MTVGMRTIDLVEMFSEVAAAMQENGEILSRLDTIDGDHGKTMVQAFALIETKLAALEPDSISPSDVFDMAAEILLSMNAASARLYAAAFRRAGTSIMRRRVLKPEDFATAFGQMAAGIAAHGEPGAEARNIADVWDTAARAYMAAAHAGHAPVECLTSALSAAEGDTETSSLLAGTEAFMTGRRFMDAGAISALVMIRAMRDALR
ncbi:DAK2 domain-containing protein [Rhizobium sp. RU36D]|uniref:DAK2 domain-containing protein n=1 Tax=Rhizobium sp. RU36D TaxID=1907415 RepID=UPI0009D7B487|nr:DAK2 domain-containing protein [Rhizobium sp. RU36D]SMC60296.1 dihydroxyacetone kinase DhaL subunit [Rhizobium sp. RU36D]